MPRRSTDRSVDGSPRTPRRSSCPVACALDLFGDRWTLLVVRDLLQGRRRFKEFASSPEGIPTNLLADRLERLVAGGLVDRVPLQGEKRLVYELTEKGRSLHPVLAAVKEWGLRWEEGAEAQRTEIP